MASRKLAEMVASTIGTLRAFELSFTSFGPSFRNSSATGWTRAEIGQVNRLRVAITVELGALSGIESGSCL
ncbi:hypothetical protein AAMO2058_001030400, partial [Amorphochlora amoebiformis]